MFNEKSHAWIKIYKIITIVLCFTFATLGFIFGIGDASAEYMDIGIGGDDDGFLDFMLWQIVGVAVGFIHLVSNMLVIQLLNNVQLIRESVYQEPEAQASVYPTAVAPQVADTSWYCSTCGTHNDQNAKFCIKCGSPK